MKITKQRPTAPAGRWVMILEGTERVPADEGLFGKPAIRFTFAGSGELDGYIATKTASAFATADNTLGEIVDSLAGREVPVGEEVDLADFVGTPYDIVIEKTATGVKIAKIQKQEEA